MSRNSSGDPHPQLPSPSTATQLPPLSFKHCRSFSHSSYVTNQLYPHSQSFPGDSKEYRRFHGGIGVGYQERREKSVVARRRPPVSQGGNPVHHHASSFGPFFQADSFKIPAGGLVQKTATATGGTGVFIPLYCTRMISVQDDDLNDNGGMEGGENQQKDYEEETPIEMLLPSEWTY